MCKRADRTVLGLVGKPPNGPGNTRRPLSAAGAGHFHNSVPPSGLRGPPEPPQQVQRSPFNQRLLRSLLCGTLSNQASR